MKVPECYGQYKYTDDCEACRHSQDCYSAAQEFENDEEEEEE